MRAAVAVKVLIGFGVIVFLVVRGCRDSDRADANRRPQEALRQAKDLSRQWADGFSASTVPSRPPGLADELLQEVEDSAADEPVREEARALRAAFGRRPHYLRMAANAAGFRAEADRYLALAAAAGAGPDVAPGPVSAGVLVVTVRKSPAGAPEAYFDAELVDACGPATAADPTGVRTLVTLAWEQETIGEYQVKGFVVKGQEVPVRPGTDLPAGPAYRRTCVATVFRFPDGRVVGRQRFTADDPAVRSARGGEPTAEARVRAEVVKFLAGLPTPATGPES